MVKYTCAVAIAILAVGITTLTSPLAALAVDPAMVDRESEAALKTLYEATPAARELAGKAKGILIFPNIVKAGFIFGAQYGDGELLKGSEVAGRYNISAVSYGLQAGIQAFAYAMFFMTDSALTYLDRSAGFEVGAGPSVVILDEGLAETVPTTSTLQSDVYGFVFGQKGTHGGSQATGLEDHQAQPIGVYIEERAPSCRRPSRRFPLLRSFSVIALCAVSKTTTQDWGFTAQLDKGAVFGRGNWVTVGVAYGGHSSSFNQSEAEADLIPDGNSVGVQQTEPFETAVDVHTTQQNVGVYITDTFDACRMDSRSAAIAPLSRSGRTARWTIQRRCAGARPLGSRVACSRSPIYVFTIPILAFTMTDPGVHVPLIASRWSHHFVLVDVLASGFEEHRDVPRTRNAFTSSLPEHPTAFSS